MSSIHSNYKYSTPVINKLSKDKNRKNKLKKSISKFQSEYFISSNKKIEEKLTFKNRNKYSLLMNPWVKD